MQVVESAEFVPVTAKGATLAIGNFDGVHRGHQVLIAEAVAKAKENGSAPGVLVFEPHPREFFHPEEPHFRLTPLARKLELFERLGIKVAIVQPFDAVLAAMPAETFVAEILVNRLAVRHVVIGYHFFYGTKRGGNPETMRAAGKAHGFGVSVVDPVADDGDVFSSTAIRLRLAQDDVKAAAQALGRFWQVTGKVVGGAKRGTGMGFPTANVPMPKGTTLGHGIYAVRAYLDGQREPLAAAAYLGTRPTFDDGMPVLEVFLFDFDGDLYGRQMTVEFIDFIRGDRKFSSADELVAQMQTDCAKARDILAATPMTSG